MKTEYSLPPVAVTEIKPYRYDLIDFSHNRVRMPGWRPLRGCPFSCNFCVLTGHETYRYRPIKSVIDEIEFKMAVEPALLRPTTRLVHVLGQQSWRLPALPTSTLEALIPLKKTWGCALTFNILRDEDTVKLMPKQAVVMSTQA